MKHPFRSAPARALAVCLALGLFHGAAQAEAPAAPAAEAPGSAPPPAAAPVEQLDRVRQEQIEADKAALDAQQRINRIDDETQKMLSDYRRAMADAESHSAYAAQLTRQVASQQEELAEIQRQLDEVETTSRAIVPLEQKMLATLKEFVRLDIPFLLEERTARVETLEKMMDRADVSISEKYRRIVEAYQVEMDYGRTIESYEGQLAGDGEARTAAFLRVGRLSLLYQTLDGEETGYWDATQRRWQVDNHYAHAFKVGVAVARKLTAPDMLHIPVPAPQESKS
jgi:chromosome segregation ATPase